MADTPFFRGPNRMDWLFAVMLQTAVDWKTDSDIINVANLLNYHGMARFTPLGDFAPPVVVVFTEDFVFVVSASTKNSYQWVGNVLGSQAIPFPGITGPVSAYFGYVGTSNFNAVKESVQGGIGGRRLVLIGFSLGGAAVAIMKSLFSSELGIDSACVAFGSARPGTTDYAAAFPSFNYHSFALASDPVPSVPPDTWAGGGLHNAWTPFPPFVSYAMPSPTYNLGLDAQITPGYRPQPVDEVVLGFDTGLWLQYHNQPLYGELLRTGLPETLPDGYEGFPHASDLDSVAASVLDFGANPWRWAPSSPATSERPAMTVKLSMYFRDRESPPRGFREIYYFTGSDPQAIMDAALATPLSYAERRATFLSRSVEIYAMAAAFVGSPRSTVLKKFKTNISGALGVTETISTSVTYAAYSPGRQRKRYFHFRGVSSAWVTADKLTAAGTAAQPLIYGNSGSFLNVMKAAGLQILGGTPGTLTSYPLTAAAKATQNDPITVTFGGSPTWPSGTLVEIRFCKAAPLLNGRWLVSGSSTAGQIILSGSARFSAPTALNGRIFKVEPTEFSVDLIDFNGVSDHKCGLPSFLQRGRRSPQLRHR